MAEFKVRTKGNAEPHGRPRVYFCCHPDDFDRYFDKICEDIFATHQPAIYYTADMTEPLDETNITVDLGRMNLFVVPVTFKLMNEENRAMSVDIAYAKEHNIPILPFMMESGIDEIYSKPENFGEKQYLSPFSTDVTEISYAEKLKKILEAILISDEMATRIRAAFDAYIFLSYRKKDRQYANELMRIIHNIPGCRDIAIWYDEFLTPGESFMTNIKRALKNSKLFTLLVTPNLLEDGNFVMCEEYPAAKREGMDILPAEMQKTNHTELSKKFDGISNCIDPHHYLFSELLLHSIAKIAKTENDNNSEHNFLIGLAYLDGIDVEVNVKRGIQLITMAAENGLPEAMTKLYNMYLNGDRVRTNLHNAKKWAERLADFYTNEYGEGHSIALMWLHNLGFMHFVSGEYGKACDIQTKVYELKIKYLGKEHPDTILALNNIAFTYGAMGNVKRQYELLNESYEISVIIGGDSDATTMLILHNMANCLISLGEYTNALKLSEIAYKLRARALGEEHPDTILSLGQIGICYRMLGQFVKALDIEEKTYNMQCKALGKNHMTTIYTLSNLGVGYYKLGNYSKAREIHQQVYKIRCSVYSEEHPDTVITMNNLAMACNDLGQLVVAKNLQEKACQLQKKISGEESPMALLLQHNLAKIYMKLEKPSEALKIQELVCERHIRLFSNEHPDSLVYLETLAVINNQLGRYQKFLEITEHVYKQQCRILGEKHPETILSLYNIAIAYYNQKNYRISCEIMEKVYNLRINNPNETYANKLLTIRLMFILYIANLEFKKIASLIKTYINLLKTKK